MKLSAHDNVILRGLIGEYAEIAALPIHREKAELWRKLNRLEPVRPLVYINEIPWWELAANDPELSLQCEDDHCRGIEQGLRQTLYQWRHFPGDMVLDPILYISIGCTPTSTYADYGIQEQTIRSEGSHDVRWVSLINSEADVDQLRTPEVTVDWDGTERRFQLMSELCDGLLPVAKRGIIHQWCSPWDQMIHWYNIEQLYLDMIDRPELVHRLLTRFMTAVHAVLDKQEELGLLSASNGNHRVGSGGLGITDELPQPDAAPDHARPCDQWGCATAQIFSEVSPDMHEEFALQYERPYMERFGLSYYGCCEPLHKKIGMLRSVKNLRKISMSPWINLDTAAAEMGADYVFSYKPNPSFLAMESWDPAIVRQNLRHVLDRTRGCRVELILKDISTVRNEPHRLWEWETVAMEVVSEQ